MKNSDQKYSEACERSIGLHECIKAQGDTASSKHDKYKGKTLKQAKHGLGIRENDEHYDARVNKLIK